MKGLAKRLKELRAKSGKTLHQVAKATGLSVTSVWRIESRDCAISAYSLVALSRCYGVSCDEILGLKGE